ncbi:hypothetical protein Chor_013139 [Crotalus horridus]
MEHMDLGGRIQPIGKPQPWGKLIRLGLEQAEPHVLLLKKEWTIGRKKGTVPPEPSPCSRKTDSPSRRGDFEILCKVGGPGEKRQEALPDVQVKLADLAMLISFSPPFPLSLQGCDLSFPGNKLVSGYHCKITVDEKSGQVLLQDTSTNGTVINKQKVVKKQTCPLQTGDVIYVVYRKFEPENNVAYLYESLHPKKDGANDPGEAKVDSGCHTTKDTSSTRESRDGTSTASPPPASQPSYEEPQPSTSTSNLFEVVPTSPTESVSTEKAKPSVVGKDGATLTSLADGEASSALQVATTDGQAMRDPGDVKSATMKPDKMGESLSCIICQELLHDCVRYRWMDREGSSAYELVAHWRSLQPCMHTFCAACYSGWMERSSLCPTCRCPVERICKNHILNNLVEAYLIQHPGT